MISIVFIFFVIILFSFYNRIVDMGNIWCRDNFSDNYMWLCVEGEKIDPTPHTFSLKFEWKGNLAGLMPILSTICGTVLYPMKPNLTE